MKMRYWISTKYALWFKAKPGLFEITYQQKFSSTCFSFRHKRYSFRKEIVMTIICLFLLIIASVAFLWSLYDESNVKLGWGCI